MKRKISLLASLACANFKYLENDIRQMEQCGIDYLHVDIMDGLFVPNFALDFSIAETVKGMTNIPLDCHLMIESPERYIEKAASLSPEYISIHAEATHHVQRALKQIRSFNIKAGIALNPATPLDNLNYILEDIDMVLIMTVNPGFAGQQIIPATIRKIEETRRLLDESGYSHVEIQVDGNVSFANIPVLVKAGATMLVGGSSSVFSKEYTIMESVSIIHNLYQ